ncbi:phosphatase PAP2 family protein [Thalassobacillus devorans]|uniref:phosphatase PAP2 family protein n=1 Tax=Thalassobacillus devorans TaxID=279813 RepID=UPI000685C9CA|nr:phosphatase PAP2 family protein [Thalassobacillus devorans]
MTKKQRYFVAAMVILALLSVIIFTVEVTGEGKPAIDRWANQFVADIEGSSVETVFRWVTELGSSITLYTIAIIFGLILWLHYKDLVAGIMLVLGVAAGYSANFAIKHVVDRERPRILESVDGTGLSFPSGHAMVSLITYGLLIYFLIGKINNTKTAIWMIAAGVVLILFIGFSRYILRVHYLTDVVAGFSFGIIVLVIWLSFYHWLKKRKQSSPS